MSHEVKVIFMGMCLWWLPHNGNHYVLMPNLYDASPRHVAKLSASPAAFVGGCPTGFQTDGALCVFDLNKNAAPGGVHLALLTNTPAGALQRDAFCAIPALRTATAATTYQLLPAYTPPSGTGNVAWMEAVGGKPLAVVEPCPEGPENCARAVEWSVPVSDDSHVVLSLSNVKTSGAPATILVQLADGATIAVSNQPSDVVMRTAHASHTTETPPTKDWCNYFRMIASNGLTPECIGPEPPLCSTSPAAARRTRVSNAPLFTTIACSNSQYP